MPFQIGLDLPGGVFEDYLHPRNPIAEALPALGKLLGSGLDLALGLPNEDVYGPHWSSEMAKAHFRGQGGNGSVFVDDAGNISESPIPDSTYGGVAGSDVGQAAPAERLFQNPMFDGGTLAQRLRSATPPYMAGERRATETASAPWMPPSSGKT